MKVLLYFEGQEAIKTSGIGRALSHQIRALESQCIEYTLNPKDDFDIAHINTYFPASKRLVKRLKRKHIPVIVHGHSTKEDFRYSFKAWRLMALWFNPNLMWFYSHADLIITPTEYSKKLIDSYHRGVECIHVSNGIDPNVTLELFPQVMKDVDKNRKKVKEEVSKSGSYNNNLKLDEKSPNTAPRNFGSKKIDIFEEEGMNFIQYLNNIFKNIELYLYHSYLKNKKNPNLIYGKKAEYEKINPNGLLPYLKNELELLKQKYAEYCSYDDTSKMKEIKKYQNSCQKWMETYRNDFVVVTLGDILLGKPQETKKGFFSSFFN